MITVIGFGSESVFSYAVEQFKSQGEFAIIDLESFIYDTSTTITYDDRHLEVHAKSSCAIPAGTPIYHRVFLRKENNQEAQERLRTFYNAFVAYCLDQGPGSVLINQPLASAANASTSFIYCRPSASKRLRHWSALAKAMLRRFVRITSLL